MPSRAPSSAAVLGTEFYHGGMVRNDIGGLHPAKFHRGMLALAEKAGAIIHSETAVHGFAARNGGFDVETARGRVQADHVIVGTNGYTDGADPWLRRRLVPVRSRIIATAPALQQPDVRADAEGASCARRRASCTTTTGLRPTARASCSAAATAR